MTDARDRPFTQLAASLLGQDASIALNEGRCPTCRGTIGTFRDALSKREHQISGMCQKCQDSVFGTGE